ncbi:hypothetical protein HZ994_06855 [Akkermansiaceae bacterium]|nr:hypothetical protein HZ994_06855 [Akkermansiaceae bacterium]
MTPNIPRILTIAFPILLAAAPSLTAEEHWTLGAESGISADAVTLLAGKDEYSDHIEMGGRTVDAIIEWKVSATGAPELNRIVRFPLLRQKKDDTHGSVKHAFHSGDDPLPSLDGKPLPDQKLVRVSIREGLTITTLAGTLEIRRTVFASTASAAILERWEFRNTGDSPLVISIPRTVEEVEIPAADGKWAPHLMRTEWIGAGEFSIAPGSTMPAGLVFSGREGAVGAVPADAALFPDIGAEWAARKALADRLDSAMKLTTPDPALNRMFAMAKLRTVESINATRGGLMQGPGGRNSYLASMWCNDNAEYMAPFHPYLGDPAGIESARVTFAWFAKHMNPDFNPLPSSIIAEGRGIWNGAGDRGDAAMVAQGATRFALTCGDREIANEVWPLIEWCLEYCDRKKTADGVIASDSDELENRFSAGKTNLATSSLAYDALVSATHLSRELGLPDERAKIYQKRAEELRAAIEKHFGATVSGFETYRYHEGLENLRAWICLPLAYGITDRAKGTLDAVYSPELWTSDGLRTDAKDKTFWDRSTLFALRATFIAGDTERGIQYLDSFTRQRLLGSHVPYAVEAFPEHGMSHLSGESCLYARIFIEGMFGLRPTGFRSFAATPRLPDGWASMRIGRLHGYGGIHTLDVSRSGHAIRLVVTDTRENVLYDQTMPVGAEHAVTVTGNRD